LKKNFNDSHQNKNMSKIFKNSELCPYWWREEQRTSKREIKNHKNHKNPSCSTSSSNFASSFFVNVDFASHAPTRLEGLKHPTLGSKGQFLFFVKWLVCNQHQPSVLKTPTIEKILFILI
jgi:hypothetical protein